jgi:cytochrome c553
MPERSIASATASEGSRRPPQWRRALAAVAATVLVATASQAQAPPKPQPAAKPARATNAAKTTGAASAAKASAEDYAQRFATLCAACHGANGRSDIPGTPVLAGQHSFYAITQLFLFREGRRDNPAMTAVAKGFSDADMRGFADYIGTLPPVPAPAASSPPDAAKMKQGQALAQQYKCVFCHGADFAGGQQVPRIGGQREDYLRETLHGFRSGKRAGYSMAMLEAVSHIPPAELDLLAYYAARIPVAGR